MIYAAAVMLWGALAVIGAAALAILVGSPFALALAVVAAGGTYLFQLIEAAVAADDMFAPTNLEQLSQLVIWLVMLGAFALSILWSLTVHYWS